MNRGIGYLVTAGLLAGLASPAFGLFHSRDKCCESACASPCEIKGEACGDPCADACEVKCEEPKADIEKLRAVKGECDDQICIRYAVEIEEAVGQPFDLVLQIKDRCDVVVWEKVVALECAYKADCDEEKFQGAIGDVIAQCPFDDKLKIEGNVVYRGTNTSIDRERERVHRTNTGARLASLW